MSQPYTDASELHFFRSVSLYKSKTLRDLSREQLIQSRENRRSWIDSCLVQMALYEHEERIIQQCKADVLRYQGDIREIEHELIKRGVVCDKWRAHHTPSAS